ncbi:MAG: YihY/virulence factor BrkB family protein [Elainellaceae cyanobacterium]
MIEFFKTQITQSKIVQLFFRTFLKWQQERCLEMGAALAYYALFSIFPTCLVALSVFGFLTGPNTDAYNEILSLTQESLPPDAYAIVENTLLSLNESSVGAGIVGFSLLLFTASGVFGALKRDLDIIWKVSEERPSQENLISVVMNFVNRRITSFILVLSSSALLFLSLMSNIAVKVILRILQNFSDQITFIEINEALLINILQLTSSFLLLALVIMILFKILPATRVAWGDVWLGALITTALLVGLQQLVSNSVIHIGSHFQSYGVVGGVMVLMLWLYLTCQLFFWGSAFTYVYARMFGSRRSR